MSRGGIRHMIARLMSLQPNVYVPFFHSIALSSLLLDEQGPGSLAFVSLVFHRYKEERYNFLSGTCSTYYLQNYFYL